jgi:hypothetical protein
VPKFKDLVNSPTKKYETIYEVISKNQQNQQKNIAFNPADLLPQPEKPEKPEIKKSNDSMKDELKNFLKSQLNPESTIGSTSLDSISYYDFK